MKLLTTVLAVSNGMLQHLALQPAPIRNVCIQEEVVVKKLPTVMPK